MLRKHDYSTRAFLQTAGELLYCALFETHWRKLQGRYYPHVEVFCAATLRAFPLR
jgi:hypothetical protein